MISARAALTVCALPFVVVAPARAQRPLLEVRLDGVGQVLVQGRLTSAGMLEIPVAAIEELTGESLTDREFLSLDALADALGAQIAIEYDPRRALLVLRDPMRSLAATRKRYESLAAESRARPSEAFGTGFFSAITADTDGEHIIEAGWNFGRLALNAATSTASGQRWGVAVQPLPRTWLSLEDSERHGQLATARWAGGRIFARVSYASADDDVLAQLGASLGRASLFIHRDPRDWSAALTLRGPVDVTVARVRDQLTTRLSLGRNASPFSLPRVR